MLESSEEAFEGFGVLRSFKANSYRIFGQPWSSRNNLVLPCCSMNLIRCFENQRKAIYCPPKQNDLFKIELLLPTELGHFDQFNLTYNPTLSHYSKNRKHVIGWYLTSNRVRPLPLQIIPEKNDLSWYHDYKKNFEPRHDKPNKILGGCPGWSESSLGAHSFCLFCHVVVHLLLTWMT